MMLNPCGRQMQREHFAAQFLAALLSRGCTQLSVYAAGVSLWFMPIPMPRPLWDAVMCSDTAIP